MSKRNQNEKRFVYSTNPDWKSNESLSDESTQNSPGRQTLKIYLVRLGGGKFMTCVTGFVGTKEEIENLCKILKQKCGTGGSVKDGEILIQGDNREKILVLLTTMGHSAKKAGG